MAAARTRSSMALLMAAAAALAIAMALLPSCHAIKAECGLILPCTDATCEAYCKQLGYEEPKIHCVDRKKHEIYDTCCCRAKNLEAADTTSPPPLAATAPPPLSGL